METRIIKFRFWHNNKMYPDFYQELDGYSLEMLLNSKNNGGAIPMQYIGQNDENDKEIYEGDLIECAYCKKEYGVVTWNNDMSRFDLKWGDKDCGNARHTRMDDWSNVVGNIYENKDLLK